MGITKEAIFKAANQLTAEGKNPTLANTRKILGGGSFTTISEAIKEWRAANAPPISTQLAAPEAIDRKLAEFGAELWSAAIAMANDRLDGERAAMEAARAEIEAQKTEAADLADHLEAELEKERERAKEAAAQAATLQARLAEALRANEQAASDARAQDARIDEMASRIEDARSMDERHSKAFAAELSRHEATRERLQAAQSELAATRAELAAAKEKVQSAALLTSIQRQLDDAKQGEARERAAAAMAREAAAKLSGQLAALSEPPKKAVFQGAESISGPALDNPITSA